MKVTGPKGVTWWRFQHKTWQAAFTSTDSRGMANSSPARWCSSSSSIQRLRGRIPLTIHTGSGPFSESNLSNDPECVASCISEWHSILPVLVAQDDFRAVREGIGNSTKKLLHGKLSTLPVSDVIIPAQKADRDREGI